MAAEPNGSYRQDAKDAKSVSSAHKNDAPEKPRKVRSRPKREKSVVETARELMQTLDSGKAKSQAQLARKMGLTGARVSQLLSLLRLSPQIQNYLVKTRDENGRISERRLRPLLRISSRKEQVREFRRMLAGI